MAFQGRAAAFDRKYKQVKFFELKRLDKQKEKLLKEENGEETNREEITEIENKILYVKVTLLELSSWRAIYINPEGARKRGHTPATRIFIREGNGTGELKRQ
jgi:hypothetical protein